MTLSKVHAKIEEEKNKISCVDGRRFNSRSREKMEREIRAIRKNAKKVNRKTTSRRTKHLVRGLFSEEEVAFAKEEAKKFREESLRKKEKKKDKIPASKFLVCA